MIKKKEGNTTSLETARLMVQLAVQTSTTCSAPIVSSTTTICFSTGEEVLTSRGIQRSISGMHSTDLKCLDLTLTVFTVGITRMPTAVHISGAVLISINSITTCIVLPMMLRIVSVLLFISSRQVDPSWSAT